MTPSAVLHEGRDRSPYRKLDYVHLHRRRVWRPDRIWGPARPHNACELAAAVHRGGHSDDNAWDHRTGRATRQTGGDRGAHGARARDRYGTDEQRREGGRGENIAEKYVHERILRSQTRYNWS